MLFTSYELGALRLPNRLVMAPMTRNRATADGVPTPLMARYYAQRASAGLIVAEAVTPNRVGQTYPNIAAMYNDRHAAGWRRVTGAVAEAGGRMFLQLEHGGRIGHPETSGLVPMAPSPIALPDTIHVPGGRSESVVPREMSRADIDETVGDFVQAARRAVAAGFEGVEVHAANGYLLHQFLAGNTNRRTDGYGGSITGRLRFVLEVIDAVVAEVGPERVGLRVSPGITFNGIAETDPDELYPALVSAAAERHLTYLHLAFADPASPLLGTLRERWPRTLIVNPLLPDPFPADGGRREALRLLDAGADLISLGRAFLANPDLVARLRARAPLNPQREERLFYSGGETGYTDYPGLASVPQPA